MTTQNQSNLIATGNLTPATHQKADWYRPLEEIQSLGSQNNSISHLGELAELRRQNLGQFFTPDNLVGLMWRLLEGIKFKSLFDNSIGSARLLQFADPAKHQIFGVDVHAATIEKVVNAINEAGFDGEVACAGMEEIHPRNMHVAMINPPFSIHLDSPLIEPLACTRYGKFGPNSAATSDEYAVYQALEAAEIVLAILPWSTAENIRNKEMQWIYPHVQNRLRAVFKLPKNAFSNENANIQTALCVFGDDDQNAEVQHIDLNSYDQALPDLKLPDCHSWSRAALNIQSLSTEPVITTPVTGNKKVRLSADGRKIKLAFSCGFTEARVLNTIFIGPVRSSLPKHCRPPKGLRFEGEGKLDIEAYLIQDDPEATFNDFLNLIRSADAEPCNFESIANTIKKKMRRVHRARMPLRHVVYQSNLKNADELKVTVLKSGRVEGAFIYLTEGEKHILTRGEKGGFVLKKDYRTHELSFEEVEKYFIVLEDKKSWQVAHPGLLEAFPEHASLLRKKAVKEGLDKWLWDYQFDDLIELTMKPGTIAAWEQACGKTRLAVGLIKLSGVKHGLIVVEKRLISEMLGQFTRFGFDVQQVNVINEPAKLDALKAVNIIAYETLRLPVDRKQSKRITYAHRLRRRIGMLIADEGERLANVKTAQCKALFQVSAKKRYVMTGTPIANYPRNIHGLTLFVDGDGTAAQPFGFHRGHLTKNSYHSMNHAMRGLDALREKFVVTEWITWQFLDTVSEGAKREVPKLNNIEEFREWLAPLVKRRLTAEPEVSKYIQLPKPIIEVKEVPWYKTHHSYFLHAADDFAEFYRARMNDPNKRNNFVEILAKLQAVLQAQNVPQRGVSGLPPFQGLTSKQRMVLANLIEVANKGKKALMYCQSPKIVELMHAELQKVNIKAVRFHGEIAIEKRIKAKDDDFINGDAPILLATMGSAKAGYNLPQADYIFFYDRDWTAKAEQQAMARALRVERKEPVHVQFFHLPGSLDVYQAQMVAFKADAAQAGLDWGTPEKDEEDFIHIWSIINEFIGQLAEVKKMEVRDFYEEIKADKSFKEEIKPHSPMQTPTYIIKEQYAFQF